MIINDPNATPIQLGKMLGDINPDKGDVTYVIGNYVNIGPMPKGALPLRDKPKGKHIVVNGKWVPEE